MASSDLIKRCVGRWTSILSMLGLDRSYLKNVHGPCPMCQGKDRYRFDDKEGRGTYYCTNCGAGDGMDLYMKFSGQSFKDCAKSIEDIIGKTTTSKINHGPDKGSVNKMFQHVYKSTSPTSLDPPDAVTMYLWNRLSRSPPTDLKTIRTGVLPRGYDKDTGLPRGKSFTCMVAPVITKDDRIGQYHRTYLEGTQKANLDNPRLLMPGPFPEGGAVRLAPSSKVMGVAEGIETSIAAMIDFNIPVWSLINAGNMEKWKAPEIVEHLHIFSDNDAKFAGQAAAFMCARKNSNGRKVTVHIPPDVGDDWLDLFLKKMDRPH